MKLCHQSALNIPQNKMRLFSMCRRRKYHTFPTKSLGADWGRPILKLSTIVISTASHLSLISEVRYHHTQLTSKPRALKDHSVMWLPNPVGSQAPPSTDQFLSLKISTFVFLHLVPLNLSVLSTNMERHYGKACFTWSIGTVLLIFETNVTYCYEFWICPQWFCLQRFQRFQNLL